MDPELLKQRQDFMKNAIKSMDTMKQIRSEAEGIKQPSSSGQSQPKKKKKRAPIPTSTNADNNEPNAYQAEGSKLNVQQNAANFRFN
jgi:hypothetical protein